MPDPVGVRTRRPLDFGTMPRRMSMIALLLLVLLVVAGGCGDDGAESDSATPRPTAVPPQATPIVGDATIGSVDGSGDQFVFASITCANDVLAIDTDRGTVYAGLPCDRSLPEDVTSSFEGAGVVMRIVGGPPQKLFLDIESGESVEFTIDGVWIVPE